MVLTQGVTRECVPLVRRLMLWVLQLKILANLHVYSGVSALRDFHYTNVTVYIHTH